MPKNTKGGKNVKKSKFKSEDKRVARELEYKEDGQGFIFTNFSYNSTK